MSLLIEDALTFTHSAVEALGAPVDVATLDSAAAFYAALGFGDMRTSSLRTSISRTGLPVEVSFTTDVNDSALRILCECVTPGCSVIERCHLGLAAVRNLIRSFHLEVDGDAFVAALSKLFPPAIELGETGWSVVLWISLRTDGKEKHAFRLYVNLNNRPNRERFQRVHSFLRSIERHDVADRIVGWYEDTRLWAQLIGVSVDFGKDYVAASRLHFHPGHLPVRQLTRILTRCQAAEQRERCIRFLELAGVFPEVPHNALLLSVSLGDDAPTLKLDVTWADLACDAVRADKALTDIEETFEAPRLFTGRRRRFGDSCEMRYVSLTVRPRKKPLLSAYCAASPSRTLKKRSAARPDENVSSCTREAVQSGLGYLESAVSRRGLLAMQSRASTFEATPPPHDWGDIYASCLVCQQLPFLAALDAPRVQHLSCQLLHGIEQACEGDEWRYLPSLPADADDSAMALVTLLRAGRAVAVGAARKLAACQSSNGGFFTFYGVDGQEENPAVSLNATHALWLLSRRSDRGLSACNGGLPWDATRATDYLLGWARSAEFPRCSWSYSALLPLFLMQRNPMVGNATPRSWMKATVRKEVKKLQGKEGLWGRSEPEVLETALAAVLLSDTKGSRQDRGRERAFLRTTQMADGGWCWAPLFSDGQDTWFGHRAVTTALALRALT